MASIKVVKTKRGFATFCLSGTFLVKTFGSEELREMKLRDDARLVVEIPVIISEDNLEILANDPLLK